MSFLGSFQRSGAQYRQERGLHDLGQWQELSQKCAGFTPINTALIRPVKQLLNSCRANANIQVMMAALNTIATTCGIYRGSKFRCKSVSTKLT